jgi:predicted DNA-binding protein (UPF0251 family)
MVFTPDAECEQNKKPVIICLDELESLRLMDIESKDQAECAEMMGLGRTTFQRVLHSGRKKVARALVDGIPIKIEGVDCSQKDIIYRCPECQKEYEIDSLKKDNCPNCSE